MTNDHHQIHEYKELIDRYIEKWNKILFSTQPVDRDKATKAVIDAYKAIDLPPPEIFFLSSPSLEQNSFFHSISHDDNPYPIRVKCLMYDKIIAILQKTPVKNIDIDPRLTLDNLQFYTRGEIFEELCSILYDPHIFNIHWDRNMNFHKILEYELSGTNVWPFDFYINHISDKPDIETWSILKSLCEECPYLISYDKVCLVIDRPSELYLDRELVPHAEGKAAIKFADGYELYCNHGTVIPAKYGQIYPSEWRSEWILADVDNNVIRLVYDIENIKLGLNVSPVQIFHGDRQEIYYVLCDNIRRPYSHVYCQLPNEEPIVYAECISSLMATIAQCYRDGGYYVAINEHSGEKEIKQDLDKIEPIFEKFNPEQIDNWRKIWKPL